MIRRRPPGRTDRNYKGESANWVGATPTNHLLHSSRLGAPVDRMAVVEVALDLATEVREQVKEYTTLYRTFITSPVLTPATSGGRERHPVLRGPSKRTLSSHSRKPASRIDCICNLRSIRAVLCQTTCQRRAVWRWIDQGHSPA